jgi:hypothetical protein
VTVYDWYVMYKADTSQKEKLIDRTEPDDKISWSIDFPERLHWSQLCHYHSHSSAVQMPNERLSLFKQEKDKFK